MRLDKDKGYLLHLKPYRESSSIADIFTVSSGKVSFIVKGMKAKKNSKRAILQPCQMLDLDYTLKKGLSNLDRVDLYKREDSPNIKYFMLYQYINELLIITLPAQTEVGDIFYSYQKFLAMLCQDAPNLALRIIEISLIDYFIGLPDLEFCVDTKEKIVADEVYFFYSGHGVYKEAQNFFGIKTKGCSILGLLAVRNGEMSEEMAIDAKHLTNHLIKLLINNKEIKTRSIYKDLLDYI